MGYERGQVRDQAIIDRQFNQARNLLTAQRHTPRWVRIGPIALDQHARHFVQPRRTRLHQLVKRGDDVAGRARLHHHAAPDRLGEVVALPDTPDWKLYTVKWTDHGFGQTTPDYGYEHFPSFKKQVNTTQFAILGPGPKSRSLPFDFCIAQIEFTDD